MRARSNLCREYFGYLLLIRNTAIDGWLSGMIYGKYSRFCDRILCVPPSLSRFEIPTSTKRGCPSGLPQPALGPVRGAVRAVPVVVSCRQAAKQLAAAASHEHNIFPLAAASSYLLLFNNLAGRAARQDAGTAPCVRASLLPAPKSSSSSSSPSSPAGQLRPGTSPFTPSSRPGRVCIPSHPRGSPRPSPSQRGFSPFSPYGLQDRPFWWYLGSF